MLRTLFSVILTLALLAAPAALSAQEIDPGGERGGSIDPDGLSTTSCDLGSCGERGGSSDPDGLTATGGTPDGATTTSCLLESCGDRGPDIDPNGLTAGPEGAGPFSPFLEWLRGLLAF